MLANLEGCSSLSIPSLEGREFKNKEGVIGPHVLETSQYGLFPEDGQLDEGGGAVRCSERKQHLNLQYLHIDISSGSIHT
jgi:hypothetical protein